MDIRIRACATILFLACGQITSGQFIQFVTQKTASPAQDIVSIFQKLFGGQYQVLDKAGAPNAAPTTTTAPPITTTTATTTKKSNSVNFLNPDGSVNRDRAGFIAYNGPPTPAPGPADRLLLRSTTLNWLDILLRRSPQSQTQTVKSSGNQYRSYDQTPAPEVTTTSTTSTSTTKTTTNNNRNDVLFVTNGGVYIVNNKKDATRSTPLAPTQDSDKSGANPSTRQPAVEVHDKPFTGVPPSWFDSPHNVRRRAAHDKRTNASHHDAQTNSTGSKGGLSCLEVDQYGPCEYYGQCFAQTDLSCLDRVSYIGDETYRLCLASLEVTRSTESDPLRSYLTNVEQCIREELVSVQESPSCDDVTLTLDNALLRNNRSSCLYLGGQLCDVIADPPARRDLALMFSDPTTDQEYLIRLLINLGEMTSYCPGETSMIFVTDLMLQVMASQKTYRIPEPPLPTFA